LEVINLIKALISIKKKHYITKTNVLIGIYEFRKIAFLMDY